MRFRVDTVFYLDVCGIETCFFFIKVSLCLDNLGEFILSDLISNSGIIEERVDYLIDISTTIQEK